MKIIRYKTQMEAAKKGIITKEMLQVAQEEGYTPEYIVDMVAKGQIAIPANINHKCLHPYGIGTGLRTKINVNLGVSGDAADYQKEMAKVEVAIRYGAEAIMDLSNYGKTQEFREKTNCPFSGYDWYRTHL